MKKNVLIFVFICLGCGGDSDTQNTADTAQKNLSQVTIALNTQLSDSQSLTLTINNQSYQIDQSSPSVVIGELTTGDHVAELTTASYLIPCLWPQGCQLPNQGRLIDTNQNSLFDYNESAELELSLSTSFTLYPGSNYILLSPLSKAIANTTSPSESTDALSHLWLTTANIVNCHGCNEEEKTTLGFLHQGLSGAITLQPSDSDISTNETTLIDVLNRWSQGEALSTHGTLFSNASEYLAQLNRDQSLQPIASQQNSLATARARLYLAQMQTSSLSSLKRYPQEPLSRAKAFAQDIRQLIGIIQLQTNGSSDDLDNKQNIISNIWNQDAEQAFQDYLDAVTLIAQDYSPNGDNPAGQYQQDSLNIDYQVGPYNWVLTGTQGQSTIGMDITIENWRVSKPRGDLGEGFQSGFVSYQDTRLSFDTDLFSVVYDGVDDVFNDPRAKTNTISLATGIQIQQPENSFNGTVQGYARTLEDENSQTFTGLDNLLLSGVITGTDDIRIDMATISLDLFDNREFDADRLAIAKITTPFYGVPDLQMLLSGNQEFTDTSSLSVYWQNTVLHLSVNDIDNPTQITISGLENMRLEFLDTQSKDKSTRYEGGLYYGNELLAEVISLRGLPSLVYSDGVVESIF